MHGFLGRHSCKADATKGRIANPHLLAWTVEPESAGEVVVTCISFFLESSMWPCRRTEN